MRKCHRFTARSQSDERGRDGDVQMGSIYTQRDKSIKFKRRTLPMSLTKQCFLCCFMGHY